MKKINQFSDITDQQHTFSPFVVLESYTEYQEQQLLENTRESENIDCYSMLNVLFVSAILIINERKHTPYLHQQINSTWIHQL